MPKAAPFRNVYRVKITHPTKNIPAVVRYFYKKYDLQLMLRQAQTLWPGAHSQVHVVKVPTLNQTNVASVLNNLTKELVELGETFAFDVGAEFVKIAPDKVPTTSFEKLDSFPKAWF